MSKLWIVLVLALVVLSATAALLVERGPEKYLFLEVNKHVHGEVLEGEPRNLLIDFPTYTLDESSGILKGQVAFDVNKSLALVVGVAYCLSGDAGGGVSSQLIGVYSLPAEVGQGVTLVEVEEGGVLKIVVGSEEVRLSPGQSWEDTREYVEEWEGGRMRIVETLTLTNWGYVELQPWG
ncbi:MAG TPA: hypothetical protein ENG69_03160 [Candidatus Korarchaeota archaeon]|nr:hypothetical protein [Candidatus Korarchaeota archaeon]